MTGSGIYSIRHIESGLMYVGSAVNIAQRFRQHKSDLNLGKHHSSRLQRSWSKYGPDAFIFEIIEIVDRPEDLIEREQYHIDITGCVSPGGFNMRPKAESNLGKKFDEQVRLNMSLAGKSRKPTSPEARANNSAARKRNPITPEQRAKMAAGNVGKKRSLEGRANMSAAARLRPPASPETRQKISQALRGRAKNPHSPEILEGISKKIKMLWDSKEYREKNSSSRKTKLSAEDVIEIRNSSEKGSALSRRFNVSASVISEIKNRKAWSSLE